MHPAAFPPLSGPPGTLRLQRQGSLVELNWGQTFAEEALFLGSDRSMSCRAQENRQNGENLIWSLLSCCLQCIWGLIEYITKFATIRAAITGEAFFEAGRSVTDLLMRNFLKAYGRMTSSDCITTLAFGPLNIMGRCSCWETLMSAWSFHADTGQAA